MIREVFLVEAEAEFREAARHYERALTGLGMDFIWQDVPFEAVMQLAIETGLSAYDASYLQLAMDLRTPLATFDRRLREAAAGRVALL